MTIRPKIIAKANRRAANIVEKGFRKSRAKADKLDASLKARVQKAKYKGGAAQSPTPPPVPSIDRDENILKILQFAELDYRDASPRQLVERLAGNILFEQGLVDHTKLPHPVKQDDDLFNELADANRRMEVRVARRIEARLKHRLNLSNRARKGQVTRPYGWNKSTMLLKSLFYAWAMDVDETAPFNLALTKEVVEAAKTAKHQVASHFQDRLKKLMTRRLPATPTSFWFRVEWGGAGGLHLHGAVTWPSDPTKQQRIAQCLLKLSGGDAPTQLNVGTHLAQAGWAAYVSKHALTTEKMVKGKTLTATRDVAQRARALYDHFHSTYIALAKL